MIIVRNDSAVMPTYVRSSFFSELLFVAKASAMICIPSSPSLLPLMMSSSRLVMFMRNSFKRYAVYNFYRLVSFASSS